MALYQISQACQDENGSWHHAGFANGGYAYSVFALAEKLAHKLGGRWADHAVIAADAHGLAFMQADVGQCGPVQTLEAEISAADFDDIEF